MAQRLPHGTAAASSAAPAVPAASHAASPAAAASSAAAVAQAAVHSRTLIALQSQCEDLGLSFDVRELERAVSQHPDDGAAALEWLLHTVEQQSNASQLSSAAAPDSNAAAHRPASSEDDDLKEAIA